ncbi:MAG: hypothetical protein QM662_08055 [Gordonia sp. (in: high G+C Gram-positive bacteria)]
MSSSERAASRFRGGLPTIAKQMTVLGIAVVLAAAVGWCLSGIVADQPPLWAFAAIPCAIVLFVLFLAVQAWSLNAMLGASNDRSVALVVRPGLFLAAACAAGGVAVLVRAQSRTDLPDALYVVPLGLAVLFAVLGLVGALRRQVQRAARRRARRTHAVGLVTDDGLAEFRPGPNPKLARLTVMFVDDHGQERWVRPLARQLEHRPLAAGDEVDVWYDESDPANLRRIVVEADNGTSRIVPTTPR